MIEARKPSAHHENLGDSILRPARESLGLTTSHAQGENTSAWTSPEIRAYTKQLERERDSLKASLDHLNAGLPKIFAENEELRRRIKLDEQSEEAMQAGFKAEQDTITELTQALKAAEVINASHADVITGLENQNGMLIDDLRVAHARIDEMAEMLGWEKSHDFIESKKLKAENERLRAALEKMAHPEFRLVLRDMVVVKAIPEAIEALKDPEVKP